MLNVIFSIFSNFVSDITCAFAVCQAEMETQLRMQQEQMLKQRDEALKAMQRQIEVCYLSNIHRFTHNITLKLFRVA